VHAGPGGSRCEVASLLCLCGFFKNAAGGLGLRKSLTDALFFAQGNDFISKLVESGFPNEFPSRLVRRVWPPLVPRDRPAPDRVDQEPQGAIGKAPNELLEGLEVGEVPEVETALR